MYEHLYERACKDVKTRQSTIQVNKRQQFMEIKTDDESNGLGGSRCLLDQPIILIFTINHTNTNSNILTKIQVKQKHKNK